MRVALDAQLTVGTATGIGEYVRGLIGALQRRGLDAIALRDTEFDLDALAVKGRQLERLDTLVNDILAGVSHD